MHASKDSMGRKILKNFAKFWELNMHRVKDPAKRETVTALVANLAKEIKGS